MTKRDFEMIASVLATLETEIVDSPRHADYFAMLETVTEHLSQAFKRSHPRFNEGRFLAASLPLKSHALKVSILAKIAEGENNV